MKAWLSSTVLMDVLPERRDFRYRLIGTNVTEYFRADNTGRTVAEAFSRRSPEIAEGTLRLLRKIARDRVIARARGTMGWEGRDYIAYDALHLPLSDDDCTVNMLLVVFTFDEARLRAIRQPVGDSLSQRL